MHNGLAPPTWIGSVSWISTYDYAEHCFDPPGENTEKRAITPKEVFKAKLRLDACISREGPVANEEGETAIPTQISKLDAGLVGKRVGINGLIVSEQSQKTLPHIINVRCSRCYENVEVNF
ncbi:MAG: hypothetical protein QMD13_10070 [Candidatus Bathyarchaeia archaeon]|nr:hypothetical protein [Candidatus Bathyarchaeia archaeon]